MTVTTLLGDRRQTTDILKRRFLVCNKSCRGSQRLQTLWKVITSQLQLCKRAVCRRRGVKQSCCAKRALRRVGLRPQGCQTPRRSYCAPGALAAPHFAHSELNLLFEVGRRLGLFTLRCLHKAFDNLSRWCESRPLCGDKQLWVFCFLLRLFFWRHGLFWALKLLRYS